MSNFMRRIMFSLMIRAGGRAFFTMSSRIRADKIIPEVGISYSAAKKRGDLRPPLV
jgi:hypothetical protein